MSSFLGEIGGLTGGVAGEGLAFAAGFAAAEALRPAAVTIQQDAWQAAQVKRLDAMIAARVAAEGVSGVGAMADEASYSGIDASRFNALYQVSLTAPGIGELLTMLRRKTINPGNFTHGLRKASLEPMWDAAISDLATQYIGLGDIATAIVRGAVPAPSWVPVAPPVSTDHVPRFPVTNVDPVKLAAKLGYDEDMLRIMTARSGLSLAPILATQALFRGALTHNDWLLAIAEGDLRTEWAETLREAARIIPSPHEYEEARLRGWITKEEATAGAARHGMTAKDAEITFDIIGRPIPVHAVVTGEARGGKYGGDYEGVPEPFLTALRQSNIRPEWGNLAYANRYNYPSAFVLRSLVAGGELTAADGHEILLEIGWKPELARKVADAWGAGATTTADKHVAKAENQVWTTLHKSYVNVLSTDAEAEADLKTLGVAEKAIPDVLSLWRVEREIERRSLTPAQLKKAAKDGLMTTQAATQRLTDLGYSAADAGVLLAE